MKKFAWLASAAVLMSPLPAFAQASSAEVVEQGEIIVTATRRSEALSDVPIAVSAVNAEMLANTGATDIRQLNQVSPSLLVSSTSSEAGGGVARIRGIGTVGDNPGLESSVALFIDGVYRSRTGVGLTELGDVERIEVLRGPQGTLFGRNASAGLINIVTAKPSFDFGGSAEVTYGNYDFIRATANVTGPIAGDKAAARIDGTYVKRDGFLEDVISGRSVNGRDRYVLKGQLLLTPNDDLEIRLIGDYTKRDEECCAAPYFFAQDTGRDANGNLTFAPSRILNILRAFGGTIIEDTYARQISITPGVGYASNVKDWGLSGEVNWDLGGANLTSITAYRDWDLVSGQDADFSNVDILRRADDGLSGRSFKTFSQEIRLQGNALDDRLDWLVGGYYAHEKLHTVDNLKYGNDYERFINCRLLLGALPTAVLPTNPFCVNVPVVQGTIAALNALPVGTPARANIPLLSALIANPARPGFGSVAAAIGQPMARIAGTGVAGTTFDQTSRNYALFTHNVVKVTDKLSLTAGIRYTNEKKELDAFVNNDNIFCTQLRASPLASLAALPCVINSSVNGTYTSANAGNRRKESEWSGTGVVSYKANDDLLVYASYSKGYKAGGFNLDASALTPAGPRTGGSLIELQFEPEKVDAYELGAKLNGREIDINVAVFSQKFKDFQLNTFNGLNFFVENVEGCSSDLGTRDSDQINGNSACPAGETAPGVTSKGLELEAFMYPLESFTLSAGFTYANTKYADDLAGFGGRSFPAASFQLPGSTLSNAPKYVATGSAAYTPELGGNGMTGLVYADFRYQSAINTGSDLDAEKLQQGFFVVNARLGVYGQDRKWGVELWAQNLLDTDYTQVAFDSPVQGGGTRNQTLATGALSDAVFSSFLSEPRTFGITVKTKF
jgi:outer membrane receptor protein involved in Fe transport